jgi:2-dehydro-3-deoxygluconokinase
VGETWVLELLRRDVDVITMGECMALLVPTRGESLETAGSLTVHVAGAESTVARYLSDLGHTAAWVSRLGCDPFGDRILGALTLSGVDVQHVVRDSAAPTGVFFKNPDSHASSVHYYRRGSAASKLSPSDLATVPLDAARLVHVSGITLALSTSAAHATELFLERAGAAGVRRSFDVNYRPGLWSVTHAAPVLHGMTQRADIVFVGRDEAQELWGTTDASSVRALLGDGHELVVKDADVGATVFPSGQRNGIFVPSPRVEVLEPVGAGDAFAAGYLSGLLNGECPEARMVLAHRVAALALGSMGDHVDATSLRSSVQEVRGGRA